MAFSPRQIQAGAAEGVGERETGATDWTAQIADVADQATDVGAYVFGDNPDPLSSKFGTSGYTTNVQWDAGLGVAEMPGEASQA